MTKLVRAGQVMSALVVVFMVFDASIHIMKIPAVVDAFAQLGYPLNVAVPLGVLELACTALYVIPATSVVGGILLSAYFGGAVATQVRVAAPVFPVLFPAMLGALMWGGLYLRDSRVPTLIPSLARNAG
jgi:hypothetical protein